MYYIDTSVLVALDGNSYFRAFLPLPGPEAIGHRLAGSIKELRVPGDPQRPLGTVGVNDDNAVLGVDLPDDARSLEAQRSPSQERQTEDGCSQPVTHSEPSADLEHGMPP